MPMEPSLFMLKKKEKKKEKQPLPMDLYAVHTQDYC